MIQRDASISANKHKREMTRGDMRGRHTGRQGTELLRDFQNTSRRVAVLGLPGRLEAVGRNHVAIRVGALNNRCELLGQNQ
jgi:hypothetical protein